MALRAVTNGTGRVREGVRTTQGGTGGGTTSGVVFEGDSITAGQGVTQSIPTRFSNLTQLPVQNRGTAGDGLSNMNTNYATDDAPYYNAATTNTFVILGGTNDIQGGATDAQVATSMQGICVKARATGFRIGVCTITSRNDAPWTGPMEAYRVAFNTWLRANYATFADVLIDYDAIPETQSPSNTTYFQDGLHPTDALDAIMAEAVRVALGTPIVAAASFALQTTPVLNTGTFSNSNRTVISTATNATFAGNSFVSGKRVFAVSFDVNGGSFPGIGLTTIGGNSGGLGQDGARSWSWYNNGGLWTNGGQVYSAPTFAAADQLGVVIDEPNSRLWFTKDGTNYYGTTGAALTRAQVEAGTSGIDISAMKALGAIYPAVGNILTGGSQWTLLTSYPWTVPANYTYMGPVVVALTTFDPANKSASITLSENNRRAVNAGASNVNAKSTSSRSSGLLYFEIELVSAQTSLGVATSGMPTNTWVGSSGASVGIDPSAGTIYASGTPQGSAGIGTGAAGNVFGVAVNFTSGKAWFSKNGAFGTGQVPASGTGGFTMPAGTLFIVAAPQTTGADCRIRTETSQFSYTPPSGFSPWN